MTITQDGRGAPWLLLIFTLPSNMASERVGIWRKLQRYGSLALRNSGYVLPNSPANQERFEWLATAVRGFKGEASVLQVKAIDDLPSDILKGKFRELRKPDYESLLREIRGLKRSVPGFSTQLSRFKRRYEDIVEIDFFECSLKTQAGMALRNAEHPIEATVAPRRGKVKKSEYQNRAWVTRPRPGIDRVSSAWLISRFIDARPTFLFAADSSAQPEAVPYDMYQDYGFGHEGENCTFETLCRRFGISDKSVLSISKAIHDADLEDGKFGRSEGMVVNQILRGWAKQDVSDDELLSRGIQLIEGLYRSIRD